MEMIIIYATQVVTNLYEFLSSVEQRRRYFKECLITKQMKVPIDFHIVNGDQKLFGYLHSLNILSLAEERKQLGTTLG